MLTVLAAKAVPPATLEVVLSDGRALTLDAAGLVSSPGYESLAKPDRFADIAVADWGHGVEWPTVDQGLTVETLVRLAREQAGTAFPTTDFNAWMARHGLSLTAAAQALGLSRRTIVYYHTGQKPIPIYIGLACEGWEARRHRAAA